MHILVDKEDEYLLEKYSWHINSQGYLVTDIQISKIPRKRNILLLHRVIMNADSGQLIDHKNRDKLDNRKCNLRFCTRSQNAMNRKAQKNSLSNYKGVSPFRKKWRAVINIKIGETSKQFHIGVFDNPELAASAYNKQAIILHKEFKCLNKIKL